MSTVMKAMIERRNELRDDLSAIPEFREYELLESFIRQYESVTGPNEGIKPNRPQRLRRTSGFTVTDAAAAALDDLGQPLPLHNLHEALPRYGKTVTGKRPAINLSSAMSRDKRFRSVHWRGANAWWFRDRELPPEAAASGGAVAEAPATETEDAMEEQHAAA